MNFNLQIGFIQQVAVLLYKKDYVVYKFWSSNRLHRTSKGGKGSKIGFFKSGLTQKPDFANALPNRVFHTVQYSLHCALLLMVNVRAQISDISYAYPISQTS